MQRSLFPSLFQINTRVWLHVLSQRLGQRITLDAIPDVLLDQLAEQGFDWIWFLGVWQTGSAGREVSLHQPQWRKEYQEVLLDFKEEDVCGSPFAIQSYTVHRDFGTEQGLVQLRRRLHERGMRLLLDFVPNHTAQDHAWAYEHPEFYIHGSTADRAREPMNYLLLETRRGPAVLALGRDPYFPGWPDTLQLNYRHAGLRQAMTEELLKIGQWCDGVRCDMAMLLLPDVIRRTWGEQSQPKDGTPPVEEIFWPEAIGRVRQRFPEFLFMAEVYWDLEWTLQQQGFDYTYDKRMYDRVHARDAGAIRGHLWADAEFQRKSVRFLENHDEPRAASAFPPMIHPAAAVLTFFAPGLRFFHEGEFDGRRMRAILHLGRRPEEQPDPNIQAFYERLLECLKRPEVRDGRWRLLQCTAAWSENRTWERFLAYSWDGARGQRLLAIVNYGPTQGQCFVWLPFDDLRERKWMLRNLMGTARYERQGNDLADRGLFAAMPDWGYHVFEVRESA